MNYTILSNEEAKEITGWTTDMDSRDHGPVRGYYRVFNFECICHRHGEYYGKKEFISATFIPGTIEDYMDPDTNSYSLFLSDLSLEWTGRLIFRGYCVEEYDTEERENYYTMINLFND